MITKNVEIAVPLKYLSNFWRTLEMSLINFEISSVTGETEFSITDAKLYVPVVTLSTENNMKLLKQLESGFKRTINRNKYQSNRQIKNKIDILIT